MSRERPVSLVLKALLGALVWLVLSVPAALWASKVLKARREEMELEQPENRERRENRDPRGP